MKKTLMIGGALATAIAAATAFAQMPPPPGGPGGPPPFPATRAELQAKIAEHFKAADTNKDGFVTKAEADAAREAMKSKMRAQHEAMRAEWRAKKFAELDKDGNGAISKAEFTAPRVPPADGAGRPDRPGKDGHGFRGDRRGPGGPEGRRGPGGHGFGPGGFGGERWFERADTNKDGKLTLAEASAGPLAMFDRIDTNHDGKISPEERDIAFGGLRGRGGPGGHGWGHDKGGHGDDRGPGKDRDAK